MNELTLYHYNDLPTEEAKFMAIEAVNEKHPVQTRDKNLDELINNYEFNKWGDIMEYNAFTDCSLYSVNW